nr:sodium/potassium-transporting ATPase subunit beta-1 [Drosophila kikkawai]
MPEELMVPAGTYKLTKQFRREQMRRHKKDLPWSKRVFDLDEKRLFGRTLWGWTRITLFYLTLYILIALIVIFWLAIFKYAIIPKDHPVWLKKAPGVSLVPHNESTLKFFPNEPTTIYPIADKIEEFLNGLRDNAMDYFSDFNADELWGYREGKPCIFVKLNKVIGFEPNTIDTPEELPKGAPPELRDVIRKHGGAPRIWLSCMTKGNGPQPTVLYYPGPFFDTTGTMTGVQRVVAVQLSNFPANSDVDVHLTVWAHNIQIEEKYNGKGHARLTLHRVLQAPLKSPEARLKTLSVARNSGGRPAPNGSPRSYKRFRTKPVTTAPKEPFSYIGRERNASPPRTLADARNSGPENILIAEPRSYKGVGAKPVTIAPKEPFSYIGRWRNDSLGLYVNQSV